MKSRLDVITDLESRARRVGYRVDALARDCGVDPRHLRRYLREKLKEPPRAWLSKLRLEESPHDLQKGKLVKETAAKACYNHQGNFTRRFKRHFGKNPSVLRLAKQAGLMPGFDAGL